MNMGRAGKEKRRVSHHRARLRVFKSLCLILGNTDYKVREPHHNCSSKTDIHGHG